jgi:hypothetical protein
MRSSSRIGAFTATIRLTIQSRWHAQPPRGIFGNDLVKLRLQEGNTMKRIQFLMSTSLVACAVAAQPAFAQDASQPAPKTEQSSSKDEGLEEIIVTAERRFNTAQDTSASISVRPGEDMLRQGRYELKNILEDVPGISGGAAGTVSTSQVEPITPRPALLSAAFNPTQVPAAAQHQPPPQPPSMSMMFITASADRTTSNVSRSCAARKARCMDAAQRPAWLRSTPAHRMPPNLALAAQLKSAITRFAITAVGSTPR